MPEDLKAAPIESAANAAKGSTSRPRRRSPCDSRCRGKAASIPNAACIWDPPRFMKLMVLDREITGPCDGVAERTDVRESAPFESHLPGVGEPVLEADRDGE